MLILLLKVILQLYVFGLIFFAFFRLRMIVQGDSNYSWDSFIAVFLWPVYLTIPHKRDELFTGTEDN